MSATLRSLSDSRYRVRTPGGLKARATTFSKARGKKRNRLNAIERRDWRSTGRSAGKRRKKWYNI